MKKGWKALWIVCAVLAAAGIVMTVAGAVMGGFAMLSSTDEAGFVHDWIQRNDRKAEPDGAMTAAYEEVDEISLDLSGLGVTVAPSDSDRVIVDTSQLRSDIRDDVTVSQDGGVLKVETDGPRGFRWNTGNPGTLYISVPQDAYYNSFSADVGAGLLEMAGVSADEIFLKVGAGQIIAEDFSAAELEADCGAGQITLQGEVQQSASLNCDVGEVLCTLPGEMEAYDYKLSCSAGELVVDGETYSGFSNQMQIDNGSSCLIEAECKVGRAEIMFE